MYLCHPLQFVGFVQVLIFPFKLVSTKNINFHNVNPPVDPTPFPNSFKCFTCENVVDNYSCNRWAEDKWCPQDTHYCLTVHHFASHGRTKSVTKKCAAKEECRNVGCHHYREYGHMECISCCEGMICNVDIPTNRTNAVFAIMHARKASSRTVKRTVNIAMLVLGMLVTWLL